MRLGERIEEGNKQMTVESRVEENKELHKKMEK